MSDLCFLTLLEVSAKIRSGALSPVEVTKAELDRIATLDPKLKSYATVMADSAMAQAKQAEAEIGRGEIKGPLHGVPFAVKDLCWTLNTPTAAGMTIYKDYIASGRRDSREASFRCRRRDPRQAPTHRRRLCRPSSQHHAAAQSMERRGMAGRLLERLGRRDRRRPLLRLFGFRHRRLHSVSVRREWRHRSQADLGARQPLRRL